MRLAEGVEVAVAEKVVAVEVAVEVEVAVAAEVVSIKVRPSYFVTQNKNKITY
jgi:hypothetical protein